MPEYQQPNILIKTKSQKEIHNCVALSDTTILLMRGILLPTSSWESTHSTTEEGQRGRQAQPWGTAVALWGTTSPRLEDSAPAPKACVLGPSAGSREVGGPVLWGTWALHSVYNILDKRTGFRKNRKTWVWILVILSSLRTCTSYHF